MKTPLGTELDLGAGHIVLDGFPALRERGTTPPPLLGPCLLWPWSPISATAELLLSIIVIVIVISLEHSTVVIGVLKFKFEYPILFLEKSLIVLGLFHCKY